MPKNKLRNFHVVLTQPVVVTVADHRVVFVGANLLNRRVMIEYDVTPTPSRHPPFGPHLGILEVTDDADSGVYPTMWEDFAWEFLVPGRVTTRLERRPPAGATRLMVSFWALREPLDFSRRPRLGGPWDRDCGRRLVEFEIPLPAGHGVPRKSSSL